ncbi:vacuolar sorting protein 39 domain 2-domain-containing protein [Rhizopus microsporus]
MPYTPYTLQTILASSCVQREEPVPTPNTSTSFFSRRATSPPNDATSPILRLTSNTSAAVRIDSVGAWDNDLYCGTSEGTVLHYSLQDNNTSAEKTLTTRLERTINLGYGKKSVERILLIPQVSKAIVLCDSTLLFFSLPFFDPISASFIPPIKGVTCFSHDIAEEGRIGEDGTVELIVVKRRALQIYKVGESMYLKRELPLTEGAITLTRYGRILCLADHQNYKLINLQQSSVTMLIPTPQVPATTPTLLLGSQLIPKPLMAVVRKDEFLVVSGGSGAGSQTIGIFVNPNGDAIRGTLQWPSYPKSLCVEFPYVAALLSNHTIEIHNILDQNLLQRIPLDPAMEPRGMAFGHGIKVWMDALATSLKRSPWKQELTDSELQVQLQREIIKYSTITARILLYGKDSVLAQVTTPLTIQVDGLLERNLVEEAMQLAEQAKNTMSEDDQGTVYAERLKSELNYTFQKSGLLLLKETLFDDAFTLLSKGDIDPRVVIQLFDDLMLDSWLHSPPPILLFENVQRLIEDLGDLKKIVNGSLGEFKEDGSSGAADMRSVLLENAREALNKYLLTEREKRKHKLGQNDIECEVIDSCLLKIYMSQGDNDSIYQLLQHPNDCNIDECSKILYESKKYYALSVMYESKHMYEKALELWTRIHEGELRDDDFKNGLNRVKELLLKDLETADLPLPAIMHYAWWLTKQSPRDGVEIFIRSPRARDMDPDEILERLERYDNQVVRSYLEYLVNNLKSENPDYCTRLACSYIKDIRDEIKQNDGLGLLKELVDDFKRDINPYPTDKDDDLSHSTFLGYLSTQKTQLRLVQLRLVLIRFLQRSNIYSPEIVMNALSEAGPLDIEKAIVFGKMNKHQESLDILINELYDFVGAETYCVTNGHSAGIIPSTTVPVRSSSLSEKPLPSVEYVSSDQMIERSELFMMLFNAYISIKDSNLMIARTMHLLNTQGLYLNIIEVLKSIPDDWSIDSLQEFLTSSLRQSTDKCNESQVILGLTRGENLMVNSDLIRLYEEIGPIVIDYQSTCLKCHKLIGDSIFIKENENDQVLHLHCAKLLGLVE